MNVINGKTYPLWQQFVDRQNEWIGGILEDEGDSMDRRMGAQPMKTIIKEIVLKENGIDSAWFGVEGEKFGCGFDVQHGGISGNQSGDSNSITFSGFGDHTWRIYKPQN